jgi:hypothetical protein
MVLRIFQSKERESCSLHFQTRMNNKMKKLLEEGDNEDKICNGNVMPPKLALANLAELLAIILDKPTCDSMGNRPSSIIRVNA